jgi:predicted PhzF superfamily epimerase YddE/YHI9
VLWESGRLHADATAQFRTKSGVLTAERRGNLIELDFPATPATQVDAVPEIAEALGADAVWLGRSMFDYLIEVGSADILRSLNPDLGILARVETRGFIVTSSSDSTEFDFVSRFFAPGVGIPEDPATGSSHCTLAPFWGERLSKADMVGYQASPRGGVIGVGLRGDRVKLRGAAVTVLRGELV